MSRTTQTAFASSNVPESMSGPVLGGLLATVLALLQLSVLPGQGLLSLVLYLVVWPVVGGAIAAVIQSGRGEDVSTAGVRAGAYGALVLTLVILLTGLAGLWPDGVGAMFGVALWPVVFTVLVVTVIAWAVFGHASVYALRRFDLA